MVTMPTPMFPDPRADQRQVAPADAIAAIGRGNHRPSDLAGLSDLGRADVKAFAGQWPGIPEPRRAAIVRELVDLAENDVLLDFSRVFRAILGDPSPVVRQLAVSGLWEDESVDLIPILVGIMNGDDSSDVRAEAAVQLGRFSMLASFEELDEEDAGIVREALANAARSATQPELVRRRAMESLAPFGREANVNELIEAAFRSDDVAMRASAIFAMGRCSDRRWLKTIIAEFASSEPELRFEAARASGEMGDQETVSGLAGLINDDDTDVRHAAIAALGAIGGNGAIRVLSRYIDLCPPGDRELVADAMAEAELMTRAMRELP